jgi:hypothetical protein
MTSELISIEEYCTYHHTEITFIDALEQSGLIQIVQLEALRCIHSDQLEQLERYTTLYNDLEVNVAGIEVVNMLLDKLELMQHKIRDLENKIHFYED